MVIIIFALKALWQAIVLVSYVSEFQSKIICVVGDREVILCSLLGILYWLGSCLFNKLSVSIGSKNLLNAAGSLLC